MSWRSAPWRGGVVSLLVATALCVAGTASAQTTNQPGAPPSTATSTASGPPTTPSAPPTVGPPGTPLRPSPIPSPPGPAGSTTPTPTSSSPPSAPPTSGSTTPDAAPTEVPAPKLPPDPKTVLTQAQVVAALARLTALDATSAALATKVKKAKADLDGRRAAVAKAHAVADARTAQALRTRTAAQRKRASVDALVFASYSGARTSRLSAVLVSRSPQELLDRMTVLQLLGKDTAQTLAAATAASAVADEAETRAAAAVKEAEELARKAAATQTAVVAERNRLQEQTKEASALLARLLGQDAKVTGADPTVTVRLAALARVAAARAARSARGALDFVVVPTEGRITSPFGYREGGEFHQGLDIANAKNTPIVAAADGVVVDAGPAQGFGLWVRVRHADGTITIYGHVDSFVVRVGQQVSAGELIALMGNRGESTGTHLHFGVLAPGGGYVDPQVWLADHGVALA